MFPIEFLRNPLPQERQHYLSTVQARDEQAFLQLFQLYPTVLWGSVTETLSDEDKTWTNRVIANGQQTTVDNTWIIPLGCG